MFSSETPEWETPQDLFDELNKEFNFELDVCATKENAKCKDFFSLKENGLLQDWSGKRIWCNPPYGREIGKWVEKAFLTQTDNYTTTIVLLLPARTDTKWFHDYLYNIADLRFLKGRLKFGKSKNSAPFPSMLAIFKD